MQLYKSPIIAVLYFLRVTLLLLYRVIVEPQYKGIVENIERDFSSFTLDIADLERFFTVSIHRTFEPSEYSNMPDGLEGTNIPRGWGASFIVPFAPVKTFIPAADNV